MFLCSAVHNYKIEEKLKNNYMIFRKLPADVILHFPDFKILFFLQ